MSNRKTKTNAIEPKKGFDLDHAIELARIGASDKEIITILGCQPRSLTIEHKKVLRRHRAERLVRLKAKLFEMALKGNSQATLYLIREQDKTREEAKPIAQSTPPTRKQPTARFVLNDQPTPQPEPAE
jgi:hypothetical protein